MNHLSNLVWLLLIIFITGCVGIPSGFEGLAPGEWRGVLKLGDDPAMTGESTKKYLGYTELPFNFTVTNTPDSMYLTFRNGDEEIIVNDITVGLDRATAKDTVIIDFKGYDTYFRGILEENIMEGNWHINYKDNYTIPFIAFHGQDHRFITHNPKSEDFSGRWDVTFDYDKPEDAYKAVGVFEQNGNGLTGTFQTETGDYRFLEGNAIGDKMKLSVFDGSHAFYFEAKQLEEGKLTGVFRSGKHYTSNWIATRNPDIKLGNPYDLTTANTDRIDWDQMQFKNAQGQMSSIVDTDAETVKLVNIMGTWCPNCSDEVNYFKDLVKKYPQLEIASICYERYKSEEKNLEAINRYQQAKDITWPMYIGGYASKSESSEDFPFLSKILSYPTLIVLDKSNNIRKIHTGFNGPATMEYETYIKEMDALINQLINE